MDTGKLIDSMKRVVKSELGSYDTTATVRRIEGDTAWVHIPGGVDETPVRLTMNAKEGDNVQVRVSDGKAFLAGNVSAPPTDDTRANQAYTVADIAAGAAENALSNATRAREAADRAEGEAVRAGEAADRAEGKADDAADAAGNAQTSADSALVSLSTVEDVVGVLNWITEHGTMTLTSDVTVNPAHVYFVVDPAGDYVVGGTHYSIVSEPDDADIGTYYELSIDESVENYVATHVAVDTEGLWIIPDAGGNKVLIATGSGSTYTTAGTYIVGKVGGIDTVLASFTASGAQIGQNAIGKTRSELSTSGMQIIQNVSGTDVLIANLGYGPGTNSGGVTSNTPYYTLGTRTGTVGNYSVAEGKDTESGYLSHSEGFETSATNYSHSECYQTIAHNGSHAEGSGTSADHGSHAEGYQTVANGAVSHSAGSGTVAQRKSQVAIGEYNIKDTASNQMSRGDYVVIVGNGTADNARSNALTVDWSGNVDIASGAKYKINGTNLSASNVGAVALTDKYTRSSSGTLDWSTQTEGDSKVIAKSALAFWNGAYSGNSSNLSKCSTGNIIGSNGGTMTGQLKTSFKTSVAMGSYGSAQTTVDGLVGEVRFSSGCAGSASINTAYTNSGITIPTGWYNFLYMPHRSGGNSGAADGDNANYGNLFLFGMNNTNGRFIVRVSSGSIADVCRIWTSLESVDYVVEQGTSGIWTYRKWNSGVAECWGTYSASIAVNTTSAGYGGYRSGEITATAYPFTFISIPIVTATCGAGSNSAHVVNVQGSTVSNCKFYLGSGVSSPAASRSIHIHAIGKWK